MPGKKGGGRGGGDGGGGGDLASIATDAVPKVISTIDFLLDQSKKMGEHYENELKRNKEIKGMTSQLSNTINTFYDHYCNEPLFDFGKGSFNTEEQFLEKSKKKLSLLIGDSEQSILSQGQLLGSLFQFFRDWSELGIDIDISIIPPQKMEEVENLLGETEDSPDIFKESTNENVGKLNDIYHSTINNAKGAIESMQTTMKKEKSLGEYKEIINRMKDENRKLINDKVMMQTKLEQFNVDLQIDREAYKQMESNLSRKIEDLMNQLIDKDKTIIGLDSLVQEKQEFGIKLQKDLATIKEEKRQLELAVANAEMNSARRKTEADIHNSSENKTIEKLQNEVKQLQSQLKLSDMKSMKYKNSLKVTGDDEINKRAYILAMPLLLRIEYLQKKRKSLEEQINVLEKVNNRNSSNINTNTNETSPKSNFHSPISPKNQTSQIHHYCSKVSLPTIYISDRSNEGNQYLTHSDSNASIKDNSSYTLNEYIYTRKEVKSPISNKNKSRENQINNKVPNDITQNNSTNKAVKPPANKGKNNQQKPPVQKTINKQQKGSKSVEELNGLTMMDNINNDNDTTIESTNSAVDQVTNNNDRTTTEDNNDYNQKEKMNKEPKILVLCQEYINIPPLKDSNYPKNLIAHQGTDRMTPGEHSVPNISDNSANDKNNNTQPHDNTLNKDNNSNNNEDIKTKLDKESNNNNSNDNNIKNINSDNNNSNNNNNINNDKINNNTSNNNNNNINNDKINNVSNNNNNNINNDKINNNVSNNIDSNNINRGNSPYGNNDKVSNDGLIHKDNVDSSNNNIGRNSPCEGRVGRDNEMPKDNKEDKETKMSSSSSSNREKGVSRNDMNSKDSNKTSDNTNQENRPDSNKGDKDSYMVGSNRAVESPSVNRSGSNDDQRRTEGSDSRDKSMRKNETEVPNNNSSNRSTPLSKPSTGENQYNSNNNQVNRDTNTGNRSDYQPSNSDIYSNKDASKSKDTPIADYTNNSNINNNRSNNNNTINNNNNNNNNSKSNSNGYSNSIDQNKKDSNIEFKNSIGSKSVGNVYSTERSNKHDTKFTHNPFGEEDTTNNSNSTNNNTTITTIKSVYENKSTNSSPFSLFPDINTPKPSRLDQKKQPDRKNIYKNTNTSLLNRGNVDQLPTISESNSLSFTPTNRKPSEFNQEIDSYLANRVKEQKSTQSEPERKYSPIFPPINNTRQRFYITHGKLKPLFPSNNQGDLYSALNVKSMRVDVNKNGENCHVGSATYLLDRDQFASISEYLLYRNYLKTHENDIINLEESLMACRRNPYIQRLVHQEIRIRKKKLENMFMLLRYQIQINSVHNQARDTRKPYLLKALTFHENHLKRQSMKTYNQYQFLSLQHRSLRNNLYHSFHNIFKPTYERNSNNNNDAFFHDPFSPNFPDDFAIRNSMPVPRKSKSMHNIDTDQNQDRVIKFASQVPDDEKDQYSSTHSNH